MRPAKYSCTAQLLRNYQCLRALVSVGSADLKHCVRQTLKVTKALNAEEFWRQTPVASLLAAVIP